MPAFAGRTKVQQLDRRPKHRDSTVPLTASEAVTSDGVSLRSGVTYTRQPWQVFLTAPAGLSSLHATRSVKTSSRLIVASLLTYTDRLLRQNPIRVETERLAHGEVRRRLSVAVREQQNQYRLASAPTVEMRDGESTVSASWRVATIWWKSDRLVTHRALTDVRSALRVARWLPKRHTPQTRRRSVGMAKRRAFLPRDGQAGSWPDSHPAIGGDPH